MNAVCETKPPETASNSCIRMQVETGFAKLETLRSVWDHAVAEYRGAIYMTYDWLEVWWEFYGQGKELRLYLFWEAEQLIGIVPLYIERLGLVRTKVARLIGSNIPPKVFNPAVKEEASFHVFKYLINHLFTVEKCDVLSLGPVSETWLPEAGLKKASEEVPDLVASAQYLRRDLQTIFRLPASFEEYLAGLSASERKNRLKRIRHLEKEHSLSVDVLCDSVSVAQEFERFQKQHSAQWKTLGKGGHFEAWPRSDEFNHALVRRQAELDRVRFYRMLVDGKPVVSRYAFAFGSTVYSELPAREVGEPWDKLGIGGISLLKFNQQLIEHGVEYVDSGLGGYEHKTQLGGIEVPVGVWRIVSARMPGRIRARLFFVYSTAVRFIAQKLWYRRILPKLPLRFRRKQPAFSIRLDA